MLICDLKSSGDFVLIVISFALVLAFLRSTTCDAGFNSWIVDISTPETSPIIETAFTVMAFVTTGVITFLVSNAQSGKMEYSAIFVLFGVIAIVLGVLGFFLIDNPKKFEDAEKTEKKTSYLADLFYGFRPSVIKENSGLYLVLSALCIFNIAFQVFFPYLFIYLGSVVIPANAGVNLLSPKVIITAVIAIAVAIAGIVILMKVYPKSKAAAFIPSVLCLIVGLFILSSTKNIIGIIIGATVGILIYRKKNGGKK